MREALAGVDELGPDTVAAGVTDTAATLATRGPADQVLPMASVTKPLSAYAVLIAAQDGLLRLDEPAGPTADRGATVRHLLAHAAGLPFEDNAPAQSPERRRVYSNIAFDALGELVAERAGRPFGEYLDLEVCQPLGMADTSLDGRPGADGVGTVDDLLAFGRELLHPELLDADLHAEATTVAFPGLDGVLPGFGRQSPNDWGLGFEIRDGKDPHWTGSRNSPETFGHFGQQGGFLWVDPKVGLAMASLSDADFGTWAKRGWPPLADAVLAAAS